MKVEMNVWLVMGIVLTLILTCTILVPVPVYAGSKVIRVPEDYPTIQDAVNSASPGVTIIVGPGQWYGATVNKAVKIVGTQAVIVNGPEYDMDPTMKTGFFLVPVVSSGVTISGFTFEVELPVFSRYVDDVTVKLNNMNAPLQGVTCVSGNRWVIEYNSINGLSGAVGIWLMSNMPGFQANDNLVAFNKISGDFPNEEFLTVGIGMSTWGGQLTGNKVVYNKVVMTGDPIGLVYPIGIASWVEVPPAQTLIFGNNIGFNDLRGSSLELVGCYPPILEFCNLISRNLGENRAYDSIPPSQFKPLI